MNCKGTNSKGEPCGAAPVQGTTYCFRHDPNKREQALEASRKGGQGNKRAEPTNAPPVPLTSEQEVAVMLAQMINDVRAGKIDSRTANTVGFLSGHLINALQNGDLQRQLEEIEAHLERTSKRN